MYRNRKQKLASEASEGELRWEQPGRSVQPGLQLGLQPVTRSRSPVAGGQQCRGAAREGEVPPLPGASSAFWGKQHHS